MRSHGAKQRGETGERVRSAAIALFRQRGFHAATMREIAERAGIESATIYYYFDSKDALLFDIMQVTIRDLLDSSHIAVADAPDPAEALRRFVTNHVRFHATRSSEAAIADSELDSLEGPLRSEVVSGRDAYEQILRRVLADGQDRATFGDEDPGLLAKAILTMGTGVAHWYRPGGRLSVEEIADAIAALALKMSANLALPAQDAGPDSSAEALTAP